MVEFNLNQRNQNDNVNIHCTENYIAIISLKCSLKKAFLHSM